MKRLRNSLLAAEPLELDAFLDLVGPQFPELLALRELSFAQVPLARLVQHTLDAIRRSPTLAVHVAAGPCMPWWTPMPASYLAALLCHAGLGALSSRRRGTMPPHSRESAKVARAFLHRLGVPFTTREHAVALVLNLRQPESLVASAAPPEAYMRLACRLDLRALYQLSRAEAAMLPGDVGAKRLARLESFRATAQQAGVFGRPPEPPVTREQLAGAGFTHPRRAHRAANALRYFRLCAGPLQERWFAERLGRESRSPGGRLNLLVGAAGAGKSVWAQEHLADGLLVSSDRMRAELTGDAADQSQNYLVFQRCADRLRAALKEGQNVTFDATNYMERLRQLPVQTARWTGAEIHSYYFDISLQTALERNRRRARLVPEHVIRRHFRLLTPPALYEADQHWIVDEQGNARLYWPVAPPGARSD